MVKNPELNVPRHVGIIMDGNRRWAKKRLLPGYAGHTAGMNRMIGLAEKAKAMNIKCFTVYALSTENFSRPKDELEKMFDLIKKNFGADVDKLNAMGAALRVIGDLSLFPQDVRDEIDKGLARAIKDAEFTFVTALGYGSRMEIVRAANSVAESGGKVTEEEFSSLLYTKGLPDPDFIIRTGGELRLSNFLLWQAAYAELYFTDVLFPDFSDEKFEQAIREYSSRVRRFGKL